MKTFELVGYRFSHLEMDESKYLARATMPGETYAIRIGSVRPSISKAKYHDRKVIEARIQIGASFGIHDENLVSPNIASEDNFLYAECIAGFIGIEDRDDGEIRKFMHSQEDLSRSLYWVLRQRLASFLTMTTLRTIQLPWDFLDTPSQEAEPSIKSIGKAKKSSSPKKRTP